MREASFFSGVCASAANPIAPMATMAIRMRRSMIASGLGEYRKAHEADSNDGDDDTLNHLKSGSHIQLGGGSRRVSNVRAKKEFNRGGLQAAFCGSDDVSMCELLELPEPRYRITNKAGTCRSCDALHLGWKSAHPVTRKILPSRCVSATLTSHPSTTSRCLDGCAAGFANGDAVVWN